MCDLYLYGLSHILLSQKYFGTYITMDAQYGSDVNTVIKVPMLPHYVSTYSRTTPNLEVILYSSNDANKFECCIYLWSTFMEWPGLLTFLEDTSYPMGYSHHKNARSFNLVFFSSFIYFLVPKFAFLYSYSKDYFY